jgi:hypothetical protein
MKGIARHSVLTSWVTSALAVTLYRQEEGAQATREAGRGGLSRFTAMVGHNEPPTDNQQLVERGNVPQIPTNILH